MKFQRFFLLSFLFTTQSPAAETVITNISDLAAACQNGKIGQGFSVEGDLCSYYRRPLTDEWIFSVSANQQSLTFYEKNDPGGAAVNLVDPTFNDLVHLTGYIYEHEGSAYPGYTNAQLIARQPLFESDFQTIEDLFKRENLNRPILIRATVRTIFRDESDANYLLMDLSFKGAPLNAMIHHLADRPFNPALYNGAEALVGGYCQVQDNWLRHQAGRMLQVAGLDCVKVIRASRSTSFAPPSIESLDNTPASEFATLGQHQTFGTVLATWHGDRFLMRTESNRVVKIQVQTARLPACGQSVRALGIPETDLYFVNLNHATWEACGKATPLADTPVDMSPTGILYNRLGNPQIRIAAHGRTLRMTGIVRHLPQTTNLDLDARLHIESDGCLVPVDISASPGISKNLSLGCRVSVTGVCVMDIDSYGLGTSIPKAKGFFLVPRSADDVAVLSRPSWWTPFRLMLVIGALVFVLAGILVWNIALKRLAERRGRALADAQVRSVTSELKVYERTHLAVELHDSLSQTLSGVSMQIDAVKRFVGTDPAKMNQHLGIAAKTLKSCRDELRNCLLDLRSNALEESDMNAAIRTTLEPYLDDADIAIRFFIPREVFSDNTAHMVLRIVRELVVNALRHGKADKIKVAGSVEGRTLMFSVRDNGCGFAPDVAPGINEGHFGLQGIRERIDELGGTFEVDSAPGKGTKATVTILLPQDSTGDAHV